MKRLIIIPVIVLLSSVFLLATSHSEPDYYTPFFMERAELERSVSWQDKPREMSDPGKIYVKDDLIFVNERYSGIHVIDNSIPADPKQVAFIVAPGCIDIAVKGDIIYLDNAVDLVAFDMNAKKVTERIKGLFPEHHSPDGAWGSYHDRPEGYILVGWRKNRSEN